MVCSTQPQRITFLWFNDNAEEPAEFYLSVFPHARRLDELRSKGVGPWLVGKIATITIELEGQEMVFLNGGPSHQLNPAFSFFVRCDSQEEIDSYWDKLIEGGKPMALRLARPLRLMLADCATQYRRFDQPSQSYGSHDGDDQDGPVRARSRRARELRAFSSHLQSEHLLV